MLKTFASMTKDSVPVAANPEMYPFQNRAYTTHVGHTTELEPILFDLSAPGSNPMTESSYQKRDERTAFLVRQPGPDSFRQSKTYALRDIEKLVKPHGPVLMRSYQSTMHPNYPIVEDELFQHYENSKGQDIDPTLLSAMYCLAVPSLVREVDEGAAPPFDIIRLEDAAFRCFGESLCQPTLSTIQAGLLLMQRPNIESKTLNTQLVGIAYELGLHLDCSSWSVSCAERSLRKRLAWALYMQDKWCSLIHGRPSSISRTNWAVQGLEEVDFTPSAEEAGDKSNSVEIDHGQALFTQMVGLTQILSDVLDTFYTLQAMREVEDAGQNGTRLILERAKPVQIKLKEWFARLPASLKMDNGITGKPSSTGYLHLAYFATEITLHRCIIRSLTSTSTLDSYLSHICRSAAKTRLISAMDFVNRLRLEHLHSFWYFPSKVNFALIGTFGALLLATAPYQEEVDFYRTRLAEYRWTLAVSSKSAAFLAFAVESLDASSLLLRGLPERPSTAEAGVRGGEGLAGGQRGGGGG
ncbi:nitrogen regulatory protein otam [Lasallia pustulata]|uniref:Nitrogen regulatory protein otam n=1 Tax=Lasallia pustulata TaxID=136370 RepID=A0A1W5D7Q8_9LECA|nr:nitrogen regulatory protein otam [Lasallia pustulata]